jgi:N-acyl amino acid synthase of PEP-CTERM/exosortase system
MSYASAVQQKNTFAEPIALRSRRVGCGTDNLGLPPWGQAEWSSGTLLRQFDWRCLDASPSDLDASRKLRFEAYCVDRRFLEASRFPDGREWDAYDNHALHVGVFHSTSDIMAATARIICNEPKSTVSLPIHHHCSIEGPYRKYMEDDNVGEISRFVMSRAAIMQIYDIEVRRSESDRISSRVDHSLRAALTLYKSIYQMARIYGVQVLFAAMEQSLRRLVDRFHFPFRQIGPMVDYCGPVAPFLLDLNELDDVLYKKAPWLLAEFYDGLEPV